MLLRGRGWDEDRAWLLLRTTQALAQLPVRNLRPDPGLLLRSLATEGAILGEALAVSETCPPFL